MATAPVAPSPAVDATAVPEAAAQPVGYEICIRVGGDGALSVGVETGEPAAPVEGEAAAETAYQPAEDWKAAMRMATEMYQAGGTVPDKSDEQAGFDSVVS